MTKLAKLPAPVAKDAVVRRLLDAERVLKQATTVQQAKLVMNVAAAQEIFSARQKLGDDVIGFAHELRYHALGRLGELMDAMPKATGGKRARGSSGHVGRISGTQGDPLITLADLGIDKRTAAVARELARMPRATREAIAKRKTTIAKARREQRKAEQLVKVAQLSPTEGVYDVLVVDPPWEYDRQPKDSGMRGEVDYLTESIAQLKRRTLPAADNAVLWLWTTNAFMAEAYTLAEAWGFTVKTILTWDKVNMGLGSWLRNVTEHCLLGVRGRPVVTLTNETTLIREVRREHSRKPEAFYALVEAVCPGRKYELFARTQRHGWTTEGAEATKFEAVGP